MKPASTWRRPASLALAVAGLLCALVLAQPSPGASAPDSTGAAPPDTVRVRTLSPHGRFRGECGDCHDGKSWRPAHVTRRFQHARVSGFALAGAHAAAACTACHASLEFERAPRACAACHADPHRGEFGPACERCHNARSFVDRAGMIAMHQSTRFALVGAHAQVDCLACHPGAEQGQLRFRGTAPDCRGCHEPGTQPDHGGFAAECEQCHTTFAWQPARFDHARVGFPLTCPHRPPVTCVACHGTPWARKPARECVSCHRADYDATTAPAHAASGFPTTCASCHNVQKCGWEFDHEPLFPIASGRHSGNACSRCHPNAASFATFTCLSSGCHSRTNTDGRHREVGSYVYESTACLRCHPRGAGGD